MNDVGKGGCDSGARMLVRCQSHWPLIVINHSEPWERGSERGREEAAQTPSVESEECSHLSRRVDRREGRGRKCAQPGLDGHGLTATRRV